MQEPYFVKHKGQSILCIDLSNSRLADKAEYFEILQLAKKIIARQPPKSVLTFTNVQGSQFDREIVKELKEYTKHNRPYVKKAAIMGIEGLQATIYLAVMKFSKRNIPLFDDKESALDWLVEP